ncbi:MAG: tetratricopeptide repeat protein [bacterium]|nr:tetratricopeptide repeat protein [bacterium]
MGIGRKTRASTRYWLAIALLVFACESGPTTAERMNDGIAQHKAGNYEKAIESYTKAIEKGATDPLFWQYRADAKTMLKHYEEAIEDYTASIERDPSHALAYNRRGETYTWIAENDKAFEDYGRALALEPGLYSAHSNRGDILLETRNDPEEAIKEYSRALGLFADDCRALRGRFRALVQLGRQIDAQPDMEHFNRVCAQDG